MKLLTSFFKKKEKHIFIPTYIGLLFLDEKKDPIQEICKIYFSADKIEDLTLEENKILSKIIQGVKEAINSPKKPTFANEYDLTFNALLAFEDYNNSIHQAPYLLACIQKNTDLERNNLANEIYSNWDFRDFFAQYVFFLTWRKCQSKRSHLTISTALRFYTIKRMTTRFLRLFLKR